ncbi:MAG: TetR/AcrR family transcriptional regulator [Candidimonas sp.]
MEYPENVNETSTAVRQVPQRKRKPQARHEITKRAVEDAAEELFIKHGFGGATIDQIAKQAGVTKGGLYFCFADKECLLLRLLERADEMVLDPMLESVGGMLQDPLEALDEYVYWWARVAVSEWRKLLLPILISLEFLNLDNAPAAHLRKRYEKLYGLVSSLIRSGQKKGVFRTEEKPEELAMVLVAITDGMLLEWLRHGMRIDGRSLVQTLRRTLFFGMVVNTKQD